MERAEFAVATMTGTRWERTMAAGRYVAAMLALHGALRHVRPGAAAQGFEGADRAKIEHLAAHIGGMSRMALLRRMIVLGTLQERREDARHAANFMAMDDAFARYVRMEQRECARLARVLPGVEEPMDALLDRHAPGLRYRHIAAIEAAILPVCRRVFAARKAPPQDARFVMSEDKQRRLGQALLDRAGFDRKRGTVHWNAGMPFVRGHGDDVTLIARARGRDFTLMVADLMHEAVGHGIYRQAAVKDEDWRGTCGAMIPGAVADEVPALMMEFFVGRSQGFAQCLHGLMEGARINTHRLTPEDIHAHIRERSHDMTRQDADLSAYPLQAMHRIRMVRSLINGESRPGTFPTLWWKTDDHYGLPHELNARDGMLGDVQMFSGYMGYFGSYLPALMGAANAFEKMGRDVPDWEARLGAGDFGPLMQWMKVEIYDRGGTYKPDTDPAAFIRHMEAQYPDRRPRPKAPPQPRI